MPLNARCANRNRPPGLHFSKKLCPPSLVAGLCLAARFAITCAAQDTLPDTQPLTMQGDLSAQMVAGIDRFLLQALERSVPERRRFWQRDFSSPGAYAKSVEPNRERLRKIIGAVDLRLPVTALELINNTAEPARVAETEFFTVDAVRWPVFDGVFGEGLWLRPRGEVAARAIALPDADQTPEMLAGLAPGMPPEHQFARRLAESGCEVLVPVLIDRQDRFSGNAEIRRFTNQPHREWIYRQAYELGRHIIGYEVQKVLAAVDFFEARPPKPEQRRLKVGVAGFAEGGLIALYSAALDQRIDAALVSGYFDARQRIWEEPIYRNLFGLLREFGDAEIASLIAPRTLVVEHSPPPNVDGPPKPREGRAGAAPGRLGAPDYVSVASEFERAQALLRAGGKPFANLKLITGPEGLTTGLGSDRALLAFLEGMQTPRDRMPPRAQPPTDLRTAFDFPGWQARQIKQLEEHTQRIFQRSERERVEFFWKHLKTGSPEEFHRECQAYRNVLRDEVIGRPNADPIPKRPRTRKFQDHPKWSGYEVVLDVFPEVYAWGYLLVPKDLKAGERRPAVVCQHGLESVPADTVDPDPASQAFRYYKSFAARLAERGFVVFAPHNPYRGGDQFRQLQRKANPLGASLFSIITAQHGRILEWLGEMPFVDAKRIGFYGLSYGGKTAMRVPALLEGYALSICSADFNEWVRKNVSLDFPASYMFTGEYEMPEWNLGSTFNYAEMAALIAPRPFMVERGHDDGVGVDEWVAYEYAKVRRLYDRLGIGDRTAIEFFNGPHTINGVGTFEFLHKHLGWPAPETGR